jgi:hypothetical protein
MVTTFALLGVLFAVLTALGAHPRRMRLIAAD